ncbi:MAG TPA: L-histidine N(alpha)-methyltransferase [Verrucomicrobiae bacterium]|nr:L-histidine N(alpha)-methyltransferase [Verrucomicrobiae bacterium]
MTNTLMTHLNFLWAGLRQHGQTGGLVPSQRFLIARMIAPVAKNYYGEIIELGSGSGALTLQLARRCPRARILASEINPTLARDCRRNLTRAGRADQVEVVCIPAERLLTELGRRRAAPADFIISGIALGNLSKQRAASLLDAIRQNLGADGMFIQFQHSLLDRKNIQARFPNTRTVPVWLNFPPAFIYFAQP